jgi:hypothetical protein
MEVKWNMWSFRKIRQTEDEIQRRRYIVPQVNFPSLLTDNEINLHVFRAYSQNARYEVSGKSFEWRM